MGIERETREAQLKLLSQTVSGQELIRDNYARIRKLQDGSGILSIEPGTHTPINEMVSAILDAEFPSDATK